MEQSDRENLQFLLGRPISWFALSYLLWKHFTRQWRTTSGAGSRVGPWGSRPTKVVGRPAPSTPQVPPSWVASRCCWRGHGHREGLFLKSLHEVLLHKAQWRVSAGFWCNVGNYLLVGHGLMVMGCWWTAMEILGNRWKQGVEFRVSEEKKKGTRLLFSSRNTVTPRGVGL